MMLFADKICRCPNETEDCLNPHSLPEYIEWFWLNLEHEVSQGDIHRALVWLGVSSNRYGELGRLERRIAMLALRFVAGALDMATVRGLSNNPSYEDTMLQLRVCQAVSSLRAVVSSTPGTSSYREAVHRFMVASSYCRPESPPVPKQHCMS